MRTSPLFRALVVPALVLAAAACGRADARETTVTDDLRRDLDLAAAAGVELAPAGGGARIVSAVERVPQRAPSTASRAMARRPQRTPEPVPEPEAEVVAELAEQPAEAEGRERRALDRPGGGLDARRAGREHRARGRG